MAKRNLTAKTVTALSAPKSGRDEYWDTTLKGFWLRVSSEGRKTFGVTYRFRRRLRRLTIGTYPPLTVADARDRAKILLGQAALGHDPAGDEPGPDGLTFRSLAERYIEEYAKKEKISWREDNKALNRDLIPKFGNRLAADIPRREFVDLLDRIARRASIGANRTLEIVRRMYNWAIQRDLLEFNPCAGIQKPSAERQRDRVLSNSEIKTLWSVLDDQRLQIGARYKLQLLTAQRPGEIRKMRWQDIDLEERWWTIPAEFSKNGLSHRVPLSDKACNLLYTLRNERSDEIWVFPSPTETGPVRSNSKATKRIKRKCGFQFRPHDIRRTVASKMAGELGVSRLTLAKVLNHVEKGVTAVYDRHSYDPEKRHATDAWAIRLEAILEQPCRPVQISAEGTAGRTGL